MRSPICCVKSHHRLCVSALIPSPPFDDLLVEPNNFQHFQRTKIRREAQSEAKSSEKERGGKKTDGYQCGCDMAGHPLIVLIGEDSRALPRKRTVFSGIINSTRELRVEGGMTDVK